MNKDLFRCPYGVRIESQIALLALQPKFQAQTFLDVLAQAKLFCRVLYDCLRRCCPPENILVVTNDGGTGRSPHSSCRN